ncbi:MAG: KTSC domain-containing protein [Bacteroidetes bacterium]|jgi:hypothetical protein|nr:KTSC domain-containing protein [Bacteroidota bacterium]
MSTKLNRIPIDSSMIEAAAYDKNSKTLYLQFLNTGKVFAYKGVPEDTFQELLDADSVGRFVRSEIKGLYSGYQVRSGRDFRW